MRNNLPAYSPAHLRARPPSCSSALLRLQDRHSLELKVYKQRVKHLLYEHQDGLARLKAAGEVALKQQVWLGGVGAWWA